MPSDEAMKAAEKVWDSLCDYMRGLQSNEMIDREVVSIAQIIDDIMQPKWISAEDRLPKEGVAAASRELLAARKVVGAGTTVVYWNGKGRVPWEGLVEALAEYDKVSKQL